MFFSLESVCDCRSRALRILESADYSHFKPHPNRIIKARSKNKADAISPKTSPSLHCVKIPAKLVKSYPHFASAQCKLKACAEPAEASYNIYARVSNYITRSYFSELLSPINLKFKKMQGENAWRMDKSVHTGFA